MRTEKVLLRPLFFHCFGKMSTNKQWGTVGTLVRAFPDLATILLKGLKVESNKKIIMAGYMYVNESSIFEHHH